MVEYRTFIHVDEMERWGLILVNNKNLINASVGLKLNIEILENTKAVRYIFSHHPDDHSQVLRDLSAYITISACHSSLRSLRVDLPDLGLV